MVSLHKVLSDSEISDIVSRARAAADDVDSRDDNSGDSDASWQIASPLIAALSNQRDCAFAIVHLCGTAAFTRERALEALTIVVDIYSADIELLTEAGMVCDSACDIDMLNRPAPSDPLFNNIVEKLNAAAENTTQGTDEANIFRALAVTSRMCARQYDTICEHAHKRLIEIDPDNEFHHYNYGLFLKTRGRFAAGQKENAIAASLAKEENEAFTWNQGICATGAGDAETALKIWKGIGNKIEMGRFDLPEGGYPQAKVRLAEFPLAERDADNDQPGLEETIWIERLSPCHGIVRSVLYQDLGIDYGDVVLFDGAPVTYHKYGDAEIPVFPHLATLRRQNYQFYNFEGTQREAGAISALSGALERDAVIYVHTENYKVLCANCWRDPDIDHERHDETTLHVVRGQIAAPPDLPASELRRQIDLAEKDDCAVYAPTLCEAAGEHARAEIEQRRFDMLASN